MQNNHHQCLATAASQKTSRRRNFRLKAGKKNAGKVNALTLFFVGISTAVMLTACSKAPGHDDAGSAQNVPPSSTQAGSSGSAHSAGAPAGDPGVSPSHQGGSDSTPSSASQGASSTASNASVSTCQSNELTVKRISGDAGMGSLYEGIAFTNTGHHPCTLSGAPGVQRVTTSDEKIRPEVAPKAVVKPSSEGGQVGAITLQPQQSAYTTLGLNNLAPDGSPYVPEQCKAAKLAEVQFSWQGSHSVAHMKQSGYGCSTGIDKLQIQPFTSKKPDS